MKVGDYVRTKYGIAKYIERKFDVYGDYHYMLDSYVTNYVDAPANDIARRDIIKSSPNIIDLIEVGDYVNGEKITGIGKDRNDEKIIYYEIPSDYGEDYYKNSEIKSIVTKEQFESCMYKVGE